MTSNKTNQENYNIWSSFYDDYPNPTVAIDELHFSPVYSELKNLNVLEIGCGTGRHTQKLVANGNSVTGIDISDGMLEKMRNKIDSERLTLINGDFMDEPLPHASFDAIVMSLVLEHISDLESFFKKSRVVLKEGGLFYFSEIHPSKAKQGSLAHFKNDKGTEVFLSSEAHSEEDIKSASSSLFSIEECRTILGDHRLQSLNPKWEKHLAKPMIQIWSMKAI